jgi:hypothetical protein
MPRVLRLLFLGKRIKASCATALLLSTMAKGVNRKSMFVGIRLVI